MLTRSNPSQLLPSMSAQIMLVMASDEAQIDDDIAEQSRAILGSGIAI
jgi:hypothetical protein